MYAQAGLPFENFNETGLTGLVGSIAVEVIDNDGNITLGPTTANITEQGATGIYLWNAPAAPAVGQYTLVWSTDGTFDPDTISTEELVVIAGSVAPSPIPPPPDSDVITEGPCTSWLTGDDVADCCSSALETVGSMTVLLDDAADEASQLLYELSGHRWSGVCTRTVRPCHSSCGCGWQVLSRGHVVAAWDSWDCGGRSCGCQDLSRVRLSGYVRGVTQVKIDGLIVSPADYRVDEHRWLTRLDGSRWPACARLDLPDTEEGTFSVTYTYGKAPPLAGVNAARQLACQIFMSCAGSAGGGGGECLIPDGVTRVTRQGITMDRAFFGLNKASGKWESGLDAVDRFLNAYNPHGLRRRAVFIGFGSRERHARPVG